jgi:hypothetical protein
MPPKSSKVLGDGGRWELCCEKHLQQGLVSAWLKSGGPFKPFTESRASALGNSELALSALAVSGFFHEPCSKQLRQHWVNLAERFVPEIADAPLDGFLNVVPRHRPKTEHAKDGIEATVVQRQHVSVGYIY